MLIQASSSLTTFGFRVLIRRFATGLLLIVYVTALVIILARITWRNQPQARNPFSCKITHFITATKTAKRGFTTHCPADKCPTGRHIPAASVVCGDIPLQSWSSKMKD